MIAIPTLPPLLQTLLAASAYASLFALVILLLQPLLQRCISARWRFLLWMLVLIRFLPLSLPESRFSIFNYLPHSTPAAIQTAAPILSTPVPVQSVPMIAFHTSSPVESASRQSMPLTHPISSTPAAPFPWLTSVYFLGTALLFIRLLLASLTLHRILGKSKVITNPILLNTLDSAQNAINLHRPIPLLQTDALSSPALVGLFRPKLLLPSHLLSTLTPEEFRQIFLHEAAHLRRRDIALNYFFSALTLLHWFNPILWLILPRIKADRELACDELVLQHTADPSTYGHTLLKIFQTNARPTPTLALGIIDTKTFFKRRIHMIAAFKKRPAWLALPAAAALLIITACTLTTAQTPAQSPTSAPAADTSGRRFQNHDPLPPGAVTGHYELTHLAADDALHVLDREMNTLKANLHRDALLRYNINKSQVEIVADSAADLDQAIVELSRADQRVADSAGDLIRVNAQLAADQARVTAAAKSPANTVTGRYNFITLSRSQFARLLNDMKDTHPEAILSFQIGTSDATVVSPSVQQLDKVISMFAEADNHQTQVFYKLTASDGKTGTRSLQKNSVDAAAPAAPQDILNTNLDTLSCDKIALIDVIAYLHDRTGLNIIANWRALDAAGFDQHVPVTLNLTNVPLQKVLNILLAQIGSDVTWSFEDNVLTISTRADLATHVRTEIYNVRDLLAGNTIQIPAGGTGSGSSDGKTASAASIPAGHAESLHGASGTDNVSGPAAIADERDVSTLINIITSTCEPDSWKDQGGAIGSIVPFKGLFTISTTPEIHEKIHHVLDNLRAADKQTAR